VVVGWDEIIRPLYDAVRADLPAGTEWFDTHTHIGFNDPDGFTATPEQIIALLDHAGHARALTFPFHEPDGYHAANEATLAACAASGGRLLPLARVAPGAENAVAEAEHFLARGACGIKLHPRSDAFGLPLPAVEEIVAMCHERRAPVLFHAGRGIPRLGEAVVEMARRYPGARLILAHAGISDLGWIGPAASELPNLFFDTSWWQIGDLLSLYTSVPPGQILYASDAPYGSGVLHGWGMLRMAQSVGLSGEAMAAIAGGSIARVIAGEDTLDVGPPPGTGMLGARDVDFERLAIWIGIGVSAAFRGGDPAEALGLAQLACHRSDGHPVAAEVERLVTHSLSVVDDAADGWKGRAMAGAVAAQVLAGTAHIGL
jgi:predicted TIM-barrel fold metal-dependent hydrolase